MTQAIIVGTTLELACTFKVGDVLTNPTLVTLKIRKPSEAALATVSGVTVPTTGRALKVYVPTEAGRYRGVWEGTGPAAGKAKFRFVVEPEVDP